MFRTIKYPFELPMNKSQFGSRFIHIPHCFSDLYVIYEQINWAMFGDYALCKPSVGLVLKFVGWNIAFEVDRRKVKTMGYWEVWEVFIPGKLLAFQLKLMANMELLFLIRARNDDH